MVSEEYKKRLKKRESLESKITMKEMNKKK